jgi:hypothetical protein
MVLWWGVVGFWGFFSMVGRWHYLLNTAMERVTVLAVRIDCITESREQSSLLINISESRICELHPACG